jgi:hypothetical protein
MSKVQTAKQKRASERNWNKARVASACYSCKALAITARSKRERSRLFSASTALFQVLKDWELDCHK